MEVSFFKHVCHTTQMTFSYNQLLEGCKKAKEKKQHQLPKMVCQHANIHAPWFIHNEPMYNALPPSLILAAHREHTAILSHLTNSLSSVKL